MKRQEDIERGRGVVGFALGGSFLAVGALAVVFFVGLGVLVARRPVGLQPEAVHAAVAEQAAAFGPCVGRQPETMTARWVVRDGRASDIVVDGTTDDVEVKECLASAISGMTFPDGVLAVETEVRLW